MYSQYSNILCNFNGYQDFVCDDVFVSCDVFVSRKTYIVSVLV